MNKIYLDNAATTPIDELVLQTMMPYLTDKFGNPSAIYSYGRESKMAIENARKSVAKHINAKPAEVFFTSGGTESSNTALFGAVYDLHCTRMITSKIEHHATLHTVEYLQKQKNIQLDFVNLLDNGAIDFVHLEHLLQADNQKTIVTLMHGNNEIGNLLNIEKVGELCEKYQAYFHTDAVQTFAHYPLDIQKMKVHFLSASGHKFHGPKGVGVLFVKEGIRITPILFGGGQERNMRSGTENIYGIVGIAKALDLAIERYETDAKNILAIKNYCWQKLQENFADIVRNGDSENGLYTVLNVGFALAPKTEMLLYNLDIAGICVSGGSACTSGAVGASHVIMQLANRKNIAPIRFSFSRKTNKDDIDKTIEKIIELTQ